MLVSLRGVLLSVPVRTELTLTVTVEGHVGVHYPFSVALFYEFVIMDQT